MIQLDTFATAKEMARLPLGRAGSGAFLYHGDIRRQWESSNDPTKLLQLVGSQSVAEALVPDLRDILGELTAAERRLADAMERSYAVAARMATTVSVSMNPTPDILETLLDFRLLDGHARFPCRVLDIGPGAGRHMLGLFLDPDRRGSTYVGVESIGLPYVLQNLLASGLAVQEGGPRFDEFLDYQFSRRPFPDAQPAPGGVIQHLPLWAADVLPDEGFDLILCSHLLDLLPDADFIRVADLMRRCLAPGGVIYCRGGQQLAGTRDLYEFGYGTYHQHDITRALLDRGLCPRSTRLVASTLTRILTKDGPDGDAGLLAAASDDAELLAGAQACFIQENLEEIRNRNLRVLVWDKLSCRSFRRFIGPQAAGLNLVGFTNDAARQVGTTSFGVPEVPLGELASVPFDAIIICSQNDVYALRLLAEALGPDALPRQRRFLRPIAFAYRQ